MQNRVISPTHIILGKKNVYLNLNNYGNWHYRTYQALKKKYLDEMRDEISALKIDPPIDIEYQLYVGDKRKRDKGNVLSIIQKFFLDTMVNCKVIPDDSDEYIGKEIFHKPIYQKGKSLVEITIHQSES